MYKFRAVPVFLFSIIVILIVVSLISPADCRKNGRKRKQQQDIDNSNNNNNNNDNTNYNNNQNFDQSPHPFDAVHHMYGSSLFELSSQDLAESGSASAASGSHRCEPISMDICRDIGYNVTSMPNFIGQESQADAETQLQTFIPLISFGCASQLKFFLCSVYAPMCTEKVPVSIGPCRPLCESVRSRCEPTLKELGFAWPDGLNCSKFVPENTIDSMCMEGPPPSHHEELPLNPTLPVHRPNDIDDFRHHQTVNENHFRPTMNNHNNENHFRQTVNINNHNDNFPSFGKLPEVENIHNNVNKLHFQPLAPNPKVHTKLSEKDLTDQKWAKQIKSCIHYRQADSYAWMQTHPDGGRCVPRCSANIRFSGSSKASVEYWTSLWSALAVISCLGTLGTVAFSRTIKIDYPEKPVIYIALCSAIYASTYLYRAVMGAEAMSCTVGGDDAQKLLVQRAEFNPHCTLSFLMLYYFGMAASAWFLILSATWASVYALRTPSSELASRQTLYHAFAWIVPALQTLWVLVTRAVDADELTGTCFVGNQDTGSLLHFVLTPMALYLSASIALFSLALLFARWIHVRRVGEHHCYGSSSDVELSDRNSEQASENSDSNSTATTGCTDFCRRSRVPTSGSGGQYTNTLSSTASSMYKTIREPRAPTTGLKQAYDSTFDPSTGADSRVLVRVLIFALFYIISSLVVLASIIYEYEKRDGWLMKRSTELVDFIFENRPDVRKVPLEAAGIVESGESTLFSNLTVFRLRLFTSLFIGMSTGLWMLITRANFDLCRWRRRRFVKKATSGPGLVPLTGTTRMQHLFRDNNQAGSITFPATKPNEQYFSSFFPTHPPLPALPQQLVQQAPVHLGYQHSLARSTYDAQPVHPQLAHHHLAQQQAQYAHHYGGVFQPNLAHQSGSSATSSTSVSSGHTFAYPNPNLVLDNHWCEQASSASSHRTGNETAV